MHPRAGAKAETTPFLVKLKWCDIWHFDWVDLMFWFATFRGKTWMASHFCVLFCCSVDFDDSIDACN